MITSLNGQLQAIRYQRVDPLYDFRLVSACTREYFLCFPVPHYLIHLLASTIFHLHFRLITNELLTAQTRPIRNRGRKKNTMPSGAGTGTKPLHNKQKKKAPKEEDDEEAAAYKAKKMAGMHSASMTIRRN